MIPIADLIQKHRGLVNELARYDYASVSPLVGGFLTLPEFHANTIRLDALAHLACCACTGNRKADREMLVKCAGRHFTDSPLVSQEDPIEGQFVGNVATAFGNFRVFPGVEESADFWMEQILRPVERADVPEPLKPTVKHVRALLTLSEAVAERRQLKRYTFGSNRFCGRIAIPQWRDLTASARAVTFSAADLQALGIDRADLAPFLLTEESRNRLPNQTTGQTDLERYPPLVYKSAAYVTGNLGEAAFPTEHFRTDAMRAFCGDRANRQGNQFTHQVGDRAEQLGYVARRTVAMSALGVPASAGDCGDVDVLAWKRGSSDVFVIECKCLRTAISVRDVVDRLDEFRGERDDSLGKHLRRLNWLKDNPSTVSTLTGIPVAVLRLKGLLVTDDLVPMQFFSGSAISPQEVVPFNQLQALLK
jgi:hypothetical protein